MDRYRRAFRAARLLLRPAVESEQAWPRPVCAGYLAGNLTQRAPALLLPPEPVRAYLDRDSLAVPLTHQPRVWGERNGLTLRWRSLTTARAFQFSHEVRTDPNHVAATLPIA